MQQFTADNLIPARGETPLDRITDIKDIPQKLLMAAFQLNSHGRVDKRLLLDESLKPLIKPAERKALKRSEFHDNMEIVAYLDQMIDLINYKLDEHEQWQEEKSAYPASLLNVAENIETSGVLSHSHIFGDAFWDERGRPFISGEKLAAIRAGRVEESDPDYLDFLDRVDSVREQLRKHRQREDFFDQVTAARTALISWESTQQQAAIDWQQRLREQVAAQVTAFAEFTARTDQAMNEMFFSGPLGAEHKKLAVQGVNAAVTLSILMATVPDTPATPAPSDVTVSASSEAGADAPSSALSAASLASNFGQCSRQHPMLMDGTNYNFVIDDQTLCNELMAVIPAKGETIKLNDTMSLKANNDGTFYFTIHDTMTRAECLGKAPAKFKKSFIETWARQGAASGNPCQEGVFKENTITSRNMNAMIEAWLYSGGQAGRPVPFTYFLSKWFLESRHGNLMSNPETTATGMNQFVAGTWTDQVLKNGARLGYKPLRDKLVSIAARMGISEQQLMNDPAAVTKLSKQKSVRALHRQYTADPFHSALLGSDYSLAGLLRLQDAFKSGRIAHPLGKGHTEVTPKMGYICHLLGFEGCSDFFAAYAKNPNQTAKSVLSRGPYNRNAYLFEAKIYKRDKNGEFVLDKNGNKKAIKVVNMTLREFTRYLETFGFDDKPMQGLEQYRRLQADALAANRSLGNLTLLTEREAQTATLTRSATSTLALAVDDYPRWMRQMFAVEATYPVADSVSTRAAASAAVTAARAAPMPPPIG